VWVHATDGELEQLKGQGFRWKDQIRVDHFRITRLQLAFLRPDTRGGKLEQLNLVQLDQSKDSNLGFLK
jgi:hypothetical protein